MIDCWSSMPGGTGMPLTMSVTSVSSSSPCKDLTSCSKSSVVAVAGDAPFE